MAGLDKEKLSAYRSAIRSHISRHVPAGKSIDDALQALAEKWNPLFDPEKRKNLVEDVNALVRDYLRPIRRSLLMNPPDTARVDELAGQLSKAKSLAKITRRDTLLQYLELYLLKCLDSATF